MRSWSSTSSRTASATMSACRSTLEACAWRRARSCTSSRSVTAALRRGGTLAIVPMQRCGGLTLLVSLLLLLVLSLLFGALVVVMMVVVMILSRVAAGL
jgi:hypothetical protein